MKYDDPVIIQDNDAHSMILQMVKPNTKVLEFGPAAGRMTKLLKEKGCRVFIVECVKEAYEHALQYAEQGICGNLEDFTWKKWRNEKFDYIIFADVLEHLKEPRKVLRETNALLDECGSVLISVPNVAHNDILVKLYNNAFDYTDIGLLDETHLHLFAENSLDSLLVDTGYQIVTKQYKTIPTGNTEQYRYSQFQTTEEMRGLLRNRENGEVYQIVLELKKENISQKVPKNISNPMYSSIRGTLYYDYGEGFSQENAAIIYGVRIADNQFEYKITIDIDDRVKALRFDPVEGTPCVIEIDSGLKYESKNIYGMLNGTKVCGHDPQIVWNIENQSKVIASIKVNISYLNAYKIVVADRLIIENNANEELRNKDRTIQEILDAKGKIEQEFFNEKERMEQVIKKSEEKNNILNNQVWEKENKIRDLLSINCTLQNQLNNIINSKSWRYTSLFRKVFHWGRRKDYEER